MTHESILTFSGSWVPVNRVGFVETNVGLGQLLEPRELSHFHMLREQVRPSKAWTPVLQSKRPSNPLQTSLPTTLLESTKFRGADLSIIEVMRTWATSTSSYVISSNEQNTEGGLNGRR